MKKNAFKVILLSAAVVAVLFSSCRKEEPTIAKIYVKNTMDNFVPGATVRLFGAETADQDGDEHGEIRIDTTGTTNGAGQVTFDLSEFYELGQSGLFVLDIEVSKGEQWGEGIIKVEEEEENEETVVIN